MPSGTTIFTGRPGVTIFVNRELEWMIEATGYAENNESGHLIALDRARHTKSGVLPEPIADQVREYEDGSQWAFVFRINIEDRGTYVRVLSNLDKEATRLVITDAYQQAIGDIG